MADTENNQRDGSKSHFEWGSHQPRSYFPLEFSRHAMACEFQVLLNQRHPARGPDVAIQALDRISALEPVLSVYIETSEFSELNRRAAEESIRVSSDVFVVLQEAKKFYEWTRGAFDISAASLSNAWGFSRRNGRMPTPEAIEQARLQCGSDAIALEESTQSVRFLRQGLQINPGGIGKGYALDCAAKMLLEAGIDEFLIHGGKSSAIARGTQHGSGSHGWLIAVRHPYQLETLLGELHLKDRAIGTSGAANQFFYFQGKRYGHVIDPRSGWPAQHWLSVTVVCADAMAADALATAAYVMSEEEMVAFCGEHPEIGVLAIRAGQRQGETEAVAWNLDSSTWCPMR